MSRKTQLLFGTSHYIFQLGQEGWLSKPTHAVETKLKEYGEGVAAWWAQWECVDTIQQRLPDVPGSSLRLQPAT